MPDRATDNVLELTTQIVAAHLSHNELSADSLPSLIQSVYRALSTVSEPDAAPTPAVSVEKSVFADFIVCFEDGKKLKMLKRHLQTSYGMTTEDYRTKWGLPRDYPMVAPNYASKRSDLARQ